MSIVYVFRFSYSTLCGVPLLPHSWTSCRRTGAAAAGDLYSRQCHHKAHWSAKYRHKERWFGRCFNGRSLGKQLDKPIRKRSFRPREHFHWDSCVSWCIHWHVVSTWERRTCLQGTTTNSKGDCFHDTIKKIKLKAFSANEEKTKAIVMKADRRLFCNMVIIAQSRKLETRRSCLVLSGFSLGIIKLGCDSEENKQGCIVKASWEKSLASRRSSSSACYNHKCNGTHGYIARWESNFQWTLRSCVLTNAPC